MSGPGGLPDEGLLLPFDFVFLLPLCLVWGLVLRLTPLVGLARGGEEEELSCNKLVVLSVSGESSFSLARVALFCLWGRRFALTIFMDLLMQYFGIMYLFPSSS